MADLPRPAQVPDYITDEVLREVVIQYMSGARVDDLCYLIHMERAEFRRMMVTQRWQELMQAVKDSIIASRLGSVHNIEQRLLDRIEEMLDKGVESVTVLGERYTRQLAPKEVASLSTVMQGYQKNVEKMAASRPSRTLLSRDARLAELERFADSVPIDAVAETKAVN
jgi:hypothetical protein